MQKKYHASTSKLGRRREHWWWNEYVQRLISGKKEAFNRWQKHRKEKDRIVRERWHLLRRQFGRNGKKDLNRPETKSELFKLLKH